MKATNMNYLKKSAFRLVLAISLALAMGLSVTACAKETAQPAAEEQTQGAIEITMTVKAPAVPGGTEQEYTVEVPSGSTVLDVLKASGVVYASEESTYGTLVTSIKDIKQGDHGEMTGWVFYINGTFSPTGADSTTVQEGDTILWEFQDFSEAAAGDVAADTTADTAKAA